MLDIFARLGISGTLPGGDSTDHAGRTHKYETGHQAGFGRSWLWCHTGNQHQPDYYQCIVVNDGETIVLGGVFREENTTTETKMPILGDLPYVGWLFKRTENASRRTELLIFITPKIITEINVR